MLEDQVQQAQRHGGDHAGPLMSINHCRSATFAAFWNPTASLTFTECFSTCCGGAVGPWFIPQLIPTRGVKSPGRVGSLDPLRGDGVMTLHPALPAGVA